MINPRNIKIEDYNYILPTERIAQFPLPERDASKVLIYNDGKISDTKFSNIVEFLSENSFLVLNNTKVIQARLHFFKETGAFIEIFCLEPYQPELNLPENGRAVWKCFVGNVGKWKYGYLKKKFTYNSKEYELSAEKLESEKDYFIVKFEWNNENISFGDILLNIGITPLPPYIKRDAIETDKSRYQTVYAEIDGSVAAPTAGLHFTDEVIKKIEQKNIDINYINLNVGAGTFKPVKCEYIKDHVMHSEKFTVSKDFLIKFMHSLDKTIISVGTTTLRTLESLYWLGVKLHLKLLNNTEELKVEQWEVYSLEQDLTPKESLKMLVEYMEETEKDYITCQSGILIVPGYEFKFVDMLITNFHLPKSTLLLLIAAFIGEDWRKLYNYALKNDFRFLSYGDSSLLRRQ